MRALIFVHRWLGVAFCLLFAMWFASGIVMHFVPFPHLNEAERFAALPRVDLRRVNFAPIDALRASGLGPTSRIRLMQRSDGPVYIVAEGRRVKALQASDLSSAAVTTPTLAMAIAVEFAQARDPVGSAPTAVSLSDYDQWSIQGEFDAYRPLYVVALNDVDGTELYVSSETGEVVQRTTRSERIWNFVGSIPHWLYFSALRSHATLWSCLLWWLSLLGLLAGIIIGILCLRRFGLLSAYQGCQALHYWLGLSCGLFVLTWIFSGWLSMDDGLMFSLGTPSPAERAAFGGGAWTAMPSNEINRLSVDSREVEWFTFGERLYRRERSNVAQQRLFNIDAGDRSGSSQREFLSADDVDGVMVQVSRACMSASVIAPDDNYASISSIARSPVYRAVCGTTWYQIDGANGALLEKLDRSRRIYRWLFAGLHALDFPLLTRRSRLRTCLIVGLCLLGLVFSATNIVIACRRLRLIRTVVFNLPSC